MAAAANLLNVPQSDALIDGFTVPQVTLAIRQLPEIDMLHSTCTHVPDMKRVCET